MLGVATFELFFEERVGVGPEAFHVGEWRVRRLRHESMGFVLATP